MATDAPAVDSDTEKLEALARSRMATSASAVDSDTEKLEDVARSRRDAAATAGQKTDQPVDDKPSRFGLDWAALRGVAPYAMGAGAGIMVGGPPGALVGAGAVGATDIAAGLYNPVAGRTGLPKMTSATEVANELLDKLGVPRARTGAERMVEAATGGGAAALSGAGAAGKIAGMVEKPLAKAVLKALGQNPTAMIVPGAASGAAAQGAQEAGAGPVGQTLAGLGGAVLAPGALSAVKGAVRGGYNPIARAANLPEMQPGAEAATQAKAQHILQKAQTRDEAGGGLTTAQIIQKVQEDNANGKPTVFADYAGKNIKGLLGSASRKATPASTSISNFLDERDAGTESRLHTGIAQHITPDSRLKTIEDTQAARKAASDPAYEQLYRGGSTAPLQTQFENAFAETGSQESAAQKAVQAAQQKLLLAQKGNSTAGDVYTSAKATQQVRDAGRGLAEAQAGLQRIQGQKAAIADRMRQAQADGSANAPGAVWSPQLQLFLDDPIMRRGIAQGLAMERLESVGVKPYNPHEYAIIGEDPEGNPLVGKVPNMRVLDTGKRGLDAIINAERDSESGKLSPWGRSVHLFQQNYLKELDRLSPAYKDARDTWNGPTASLNAVRLGQHALNPKYPVDEFERDVGALSKSDRSFLKIGLAHALKEKLGAQGKAADDATAITRNSNMRNKIRAVFGSDNAYEDFVRKEIEPEQRMFQTKAENKGGSPTGGRIAEDRNMDGALHAAHAAGHFLAGNPLAGVAAWLRAAPALGLSQSDARIEALTKPLINPQVSASEVLGMPLPPGTLSRRVLLPLLTQPDQNQQQ